MSATRVKHELIFAEKLAERIARELRPACAKLEIVGSVRRRRRFVGDIEILAMPRMRPSGLFGMATVSELEELLTRLVGENRLLRMKDGPKQKQFAIQQWPAVLLDVFIVAPEERDAWGMHHAIRTGPVEFSTSLVTYQGIRHRHGGVGLLPHELLVRDGFQLWRILAGQHDPSRHPERQGEEVKWFDDAEEEPVTGEPLGCWCVRVPTPEEADVFEAYGFAEIPPEDRR